MLSLGNILIIFYKLSWNILPSFSVLYIIWSFLSIYRIIFYLLQFSQAFFFLANSFLISPLEVTYLGRLSYCILMQSSECFFCNWREKIEFFRLLMPEFDALIFSFILRQLNKSKIIILTALLYRIIALNFY